MSTYARHSGRYGKLFATLPPLCVERAQLSALGCAGGPCDLGKGLAVGQDSSVDAAWPFFGQFVAHDLAADRSPLDQTRHRHAIENFRTAKLSLECLYGPGPADAPYLFARDDPAKLLLAPSGLDVPRNHEGLALIGDARNDTYLFISQMHVAFANLHNRLVDALRDVGSGETDLFERARRSTIWHYQHIVFREFLPQLVGSSLASELAEGGPRFFDAGSDPRVPLEFAAAAYRYGHAQIRHRYHVNAHFGPVPIFPDLVGFRPVRPEHAVDWSLLIGTGAQKAKRIDTRLARALIELPSEISGVRPGDEYSSLAARDLGRGPLAGLPSGETIARAMGVTPLEADVIGLATYGWLHETPLWLYVLREAEVLCDGERLGPVGGRIVGEVVAGVIDNDPDSFRAVEPDWQPWLAGDGKFSLADVLLPGRARVHGAVTATAAGSPES